jgi:DNA polymerase III delta' subunit
METVDRHAEAWTGIRNGVESGRLAHAYVIIGSPRGNARDFAESMLKLLYCEAVEKPCNICTSCRQVEAHKHVDTLWIEPQSKARQIKAEQIRDLIRQMTQTSFEGGWKVGVLVSAECMNASSANILLKTLEEPPPKTLLLLITDSPQSLLPTIISRCQRIVLDETPSDTGNATWHASLMDLLRELPPSGGLDASRKAGCMKAIFDAVKSEISDAVLKDFDHDEETIDETKMKAILEARTYAKLKEVQADVFRVMLDWHRDVLMLVSQVDRRYLVHSADAEILSAQAEKHTVPSALAATRVMEEMAARLERNIPGAHIFDEAFRKLIR